ncbi:MAG: DUF1566 domain-containing protein [Ignavibacteria bacterium]|nr:DUF1566 domain-containing protein [Ignavibacteria bacterium]
MVPLQHYVGELYGGGIVYAVWNDGSGEEHGLIASLVDLDSAVAFGIEDANLPMNTSRTDGLGNTQLLVNAGAIEGSPARLCYDYSAGGHSDWYLPSEREGFSLVVVADVLNEVLSTTEQAQQFDIGAIRPPGPPSDPRSSPVQQPGRYWTSTTEWYPQSGAWLKIVVGLMMGSRTSFVSSLGGGSRVRAVRRY